MIMAGGVLGEAPPAQAELFEVILGDGFSKDPVDPGIDNSSRFGATVRGSRLSFDTETGIFTADMVNAGEGEVTGFGFALGTVFDGLAHTFTFQADATACPGCAFEDSSPVANGIAGNFDANDPDGFEIGAKRLPNGQASGSGDTGIEEGERATFTWNFSGAITSALNPFSSIQSLFDDPGQNVTGLFNLIPINGTHQLIPSDDPDDKLGAFWVAKVQQLGDDNDDSDRIGGTATAVTSVPGPHAASLLAFGLLVLAGLRRRRRS